MLFSTTHKVVCCYCTDVCEGGATRKEARAIAVSYGWVVWGRSARCPGCADVINERAARARSY